MRNETLVAAASRLFSAAFRALLLLPLIANAQVPPQNPELLTQNRMIRIPRVSRPPRIDDVLNGSIPPEMFRITDFRQQAPADGNPVSRDTAAFIGYDDENFYALFVCKDRPASVRARMAKRDDVISDDLVAVYFDTFRDHQHSLSFYVNPFGIQADSVFTEGSEDDYSYDTVWQSEGRLTQDGYVVWIAIPFKSIRFPNTSAQTWGFGLSRFIPSNNESSYWPYFTNRIEGFTTQLGTLEGLDRISPGRNLQFIPYGALGRSRFLDTPSDAPPSFRTDNDHRAGLDSKVIIRDELTLDVTINPDFSQVESNDPQVTANQRFEVFFPEKRPFFLENASYFQTPENLFFSRRIQNPEFGGRLTGKTGRWLLGFLAIDDRAPGSDLAIEDPLHGHRAAIGAARIQRQVGAHSFVGMLATHYGFGPVSQSVFSADTRIRLTPNLVFTGQAIRSEAKAAGTSRRAGSDYHAELYYTDLHISATTKYFDRSPSFETQLGFVPRVDIRQIQEDASYKWLPAAALVKSFGPTVTLYRDWNHQMRVQDWGTTPGFMIELAGQTTLMAGRTESIEVFDNVRFRKHSTDISFNTEASKHVGIQASYSAGRKVNYFPAAGLSPFGAKGRDATLGITLRPSARLKLGETYLFSHLSATDGSSVILNNHLLRSTVNYQFTKALSARVIADYNAALPNASLIELDRSKAFTADYLLTYLLNPGTALYIGYTDRRENLAIFPGSPPELQRIINPTTVTGRQFFAKFSYLFRF